MRKAIKIISILIIGISIQGCSWIHIFQIENSTKSTWEIEYKINDNRGVFGNRLFYENKDTNIDTLKKTSLNHVHFILAPKETVTIGRAMNSNYSAYKQQTKFNEEAPWIDFLNVDTILISNHQNYFRLATNDLDKLLDKNSYRIARIDISKLIKMKGHPKP